MGPKVKTPFTNESWNTNKMCKALNVLSKYDLCWPFLYRCIVLSSQLSLSSIVVPDFYKNAQFLYCLPIGVDRVGMMYT